jgi:hypothetical protein
LGTRLRGVLHLHLLKVIEAKIHYVDARDHEQRRDERKFKKGSAVLSDYEHADSLPRRSL